MPFSFYRKQIPTFGKFECSDCHVCKFLSTNFEGECGERSIIKGK